MQKRLPVKCFQLSCILPNLIYYLLPHPKNYPTVLREFHDAPPPCGYTIDRPLAIRSSPFCPVHRPSPDDASPKERIQLQIQQSIRFSSPANNCFHSCEKKCFSRNVLPAPTSSNSVLQHITIYARIYVCIYTCTNMYLYTV